MLRYVLFLLVGCVCVLLWVGGREREGFKALAKLTTNDRKTTIKINPLIITAFQQTGPCS